MTDEIALDMDDLRAVAAYAAASAADVLNLFEQHYPADSRPRDAIDAARAFTSGGPRNKDLRDTAWAALKAAQSADNAAAAEAARSAMAAASAAYLHPLARASQVRHILGASAHAARATELAAGDLPPTGADYIARTARKASPHLIAVLTRFPPAPTGGGRVGTLLRTLDAALRQPAA